MLNVFTVGAGRNILMWSTVEPCPDHVSLSSGAEFEKKKKNGWISFPYWRLKYSFEAVRIHSMLWIQGASGKILRGHAEAQAHSAADLYKQTHTFVSLHSPTHSYGSCISYITSLKWHGSVVSVISLTFKCHVCLCVCVCLQCLISTLTTITRTRIIPTGCTSLCQW